MNWTKEPAIVGVQQSCLLAGVAASLFPPNGIIAVGFGSAILSCDGAVLYYEDPESDAPDMTGAWAESLAAQDPDHDWRISLQSPLSEREYQRHGPDQWVLIKQGEGFA
jgi:hypothetical protein